MVSTSVVVARLVPIVGFHVLAWVAGGAFWQPLRTRLGALVFASLGVLGLTGVAIPWALRELPDSTAFVVLRWFAVVWVVTVMLLAGVAGPVAVVRWAIRRWRAWRAGGPVPEPLPDESRRRFLQLGSVVPAGAFVTSAVGTGDSRRFVVREVDVPVKGLAPVLDGFRIGQTTDVHVGAFISVDDLKECLAALDTAGVDLHVMTGDLIDDASQLDATIAALANVKAPLGMRAILGNHEHWLGRMAVDRAYARADERRLRLLVNASETIEWKGARFTLSGIDYPLRAYGEREETHARWASELLGTRDRTVPSIVLAHHPDFFTHAAKHGAALTLSGHTHGGQVGVFGRSLTGVGFKFPLGRYRIGDSQLYVSGGTGHWFPFRLGVPREVTVLTLRAA